MSALLVLLILLPALAGGLLCLAGRRADRAAPAVGVAVSGLVLALAAAAAATRPVFSAPFMAGAAFGLGVDDLSGPILPVVAAVTVLVLIFAAAAGTADPARFHGLMLLFSSAVLITLTATSLPALLFAWEIMGAVSYALIGFRWRDVHRVGSGLTAFVTTRTADLGLYLAAGAALAGGGSLALADLPGLDGGWRDAAAAGILVAALGKAAQLPFSFWLSRAMEGPSTVSALLHSAAMVAMGGYLLLRIQPLLAATGWGATTAAWVGAGTAVLLGVAALGQQDLKQLLAASTSAQLGFVVLAAGVGNVAGGAAHLMAHAATKAGLFLAAGAWLAALGTKKLPALRGAARRWPVIGASFTVAALSLAGIAPLSLWATKDDVLAAALEASPFLYTAGLVGAVLSAAYAGKAVAMVWRPLPADAASAYDTEERGTRRISPWQTVPVLLLAAGAAVAGLLVFGPVAQALGSGLRAGPEPGPLELALSAGLAVAVLALLWRYPERFRSKSAADWFGLERAAQAVVVRPVLAAAGSLARFDDRVLDRGVDAAARLTVLAAGRAAKTDAVVDGTAEAVARGIRSAGRQARRPQTGLIHQYYAQAALLIAGAVVLLVLVR
ncbi:NADH-quinone oxidoreductase subunit L [Paenarthrobacter sp. DKR-5]|uniref:proton-conducting transporter transmembrane domain-containing protein n=1 Tax=Paenarthrobacter sp. DKR-5 TaxID=2835535 RepID=UPI001BDC4BC2|nr:proton-conducting transporter membrane subunit [Paenarthrobacter sp. DKR-5]MBT1003893.1 NADH-quinone oxidoreductase subunit L [Paenarthrobacter sp. DKR-5]